MSNRGTEVGREPLETMSAIQFNDILTSQSELHCVDCFEFLWPPIMLGKKGNICGNCWKNDSDGFIPNKALEIILQKLTIQCTNSENGCKVRKHYKEMAEHSKECIYRSFCCPINSVESCVWIGYTNELVGHFIEQHPQNVIKAENNSVLLSVNIEKGGKQIKLMLLPIGNFLSLISNDTVNKRLSVAVFLVDDCNLKEEDNYFSIQQNSSQNIFVCHETNKSNIVNISSYSEDYTDGLKIDSALLKKYSTNGLFECTLKVTSNYSKNKPNEELLRYFECPVCNNYMRPPIYQCLSGHSICNECKPKVSNCPTCRSGFGNTRNYSLEDFSNGIYFPCSYHDSGCVQNFLTSEIINHERECRYRAYVCPFGSTSYCYWNGLLKDLSSHLKNVHMDLTYYKHQEKSTAPFCFERQFTHTYCLITYGEIFRVSYKRDSGNQNAYWSVQLVGPKSECKSYSYEIILIDERYPHKKLIRLDLCQEYTNHEKIFNESVMIPSNVVSLFSNNGELTYFVKVIKTRL